MYASVVVRAVVTIQDVTAWVKEKYPTPIVTASVIDYSVSVARFAEINSIFAIPRAGVIHD